MGNPYKARVRRTTPAPAETTPAPAETTVPVGTVGELLEWVGDDKDRARRALAQENSEDKPRKSLAAQLQEVIDERDPHDPRG